MDAFFKIDTKDDFVILTTKEPYFKVTSILGYTEDIVSLVGTIQREFRWSGENENFSQWTDMTLDNLQLIRFGPTEKFWIQFRYTLLTDGSFLIKSTSLNVTILDDKLVGFVPFPIAFGLEKGNKYYPLRIRPFTWNPYKQNAAVRIQKDLSFMVNNMYGHECSYFRAVPDKRSRDVILGEWTLYDVEDPFCLKLLIPNNEIPDNRWMMEMQGINWADSMEVHVDKRYFSWVFGDGAIPQKRDIIYMPLTNRMMEVNSSQIIRDFMNEPLYFKLDLHKYQPKSNVREPEKIQELIDSYTTGVEELFGEEIAAQRKNVTAPQHTIDKSSKFDPTRDYINPNLLIQEENWDNNYTTISEYQYDLSKLFISDEKYLTGIKYKPNEPWTINDDRAYSCWFQEIDLHRIHKPVSRVVVDDQNNTATIDFMYGIPKLREGQWMELYDNSHPNWNIFGEIEYVNYDISQLRVRIKLPSYIKLKATSEFPLWSESINLVGRQYTRRNFLYGYDLDSQKGMIIDTFESKWIRLILNNTERWIPIDVNLDFNTFYGMIIQVSNKFKQISIDIYKTINNSKNTNLELVFKYIENNISVEDRSTTSKYELKNSSLKLTNIRLLRNTIEEEKHSLWLNQNIIRDSSLAIIVDNAIPRMRLPYMGSIK